jgi:hypothetical protein
MSSGHSPLVCVLVDAASLRKKIVQGRPEVSAFDDEHLGATLAWLVLVSAEITPRTVVKSVISLVAVEVRALGFVSGSLSVDHFHHLLHHVGSDLEHYAPEVAVLETVLVIVDDVSILNSREFVLVIEKPIGVGLEGFPGSLLDSSEIPSIAGACVCRLVVLRVKAWQRLAQESMAGRPSSHSSGVASIMTRK